MKKLSLILLLPALVSAMDSGTNSVGNTPRLNFNLDQLDRTSSRGSIDLEKSTGQSNGFHSLLHEHAQEGTRCRKYAERQLQQTGGLQRTLSSQDLSAEEVVSALVKAANELDTRGNKHKTRTNQYKIIAAIGTGCGSCLAALFTGLFTGLVTAVWTHFHTKADC